MIIITIIIIAIRAGRCAFSFVSIGLSVVCALRWFSLLHPSPMFGWVGWLMSAFYDLCALEAYAHTHTHEHEQTTTKHIVCAHGRYAHIETAITTIRESFVRSFFVVVGIYMVRIGVRIHFVGPCFADTVFRCQCLICETEREHTSFVRARVFSVFLLHFIFVSFYPCIRYECFVCARIEWKWYAKEAQLNPSSHCLCSSLHSPLCIYVWRIFSFTFNLVRFLRCQPNDQAICEVFRFICFSLYC